MKAAQHLQYGAPEVLHVCEVTVPVPRTDEILVEVHASIVTQGDRRLRAADFPGIARVIGRLMFGIRAPRNPTPGTTFAGRVVAIGAGVTRFRVGERVFGSCLRGAHAEKLAVAEDSAVAAIPDGVSYAEAAAVPYGAETALIFLRDMARVQPGERVLVVGGAGGVGRFMVQVARHLGARVDALAAERECALVKSLGADDAFDYTTDALERSGKRYDVIVDTVSSHGLRTYGRSLADSARYVTVFLTVKVMLQMITGVFRRRKVLSGVAMGTPEIMGELAELVGAGVITPVVGPRFPLAAIADAHRALEAKKQRGAVVVDIAKDDSCGVAQDPYVNRQPSPPVDGRNGTATGELVFDAGNTRLATARLGAFTVVR